jgi:hypothetical protein
VEIGILPFEQKIANGKINLNDDLMGLMNKNINDNIASLPFKVTEYVEVMHLTPDKIADSIDGIFADLAMRTSLAGNPFVIIGDSKGFCDEACQELTYALQLRPYQIGILIDIYDALRNFIEVRKRVYVRPAYRLVCDGAGIIILEPSNVKNIDTPTLKELELHIGTDVGRIDDNVEKSLDALPHMIEKALDALPSMKDGIYFELRKQKYVNSKDAEIVDWVCACVNIHNNMELYSNVGSTPIEAVNKMLKRIKELDEFNKSQDDASFLREV